MYKLYMLHVWNIDLLVYLQSCLITLSALLMCVCYLFISLSTVRHDYIYIVQIRIKV